MTEAGSEAMPRLSSLLCLLLLACGGATNEPTEAPATGPTSSTPAEAPAQTPGANDSKTTDAPKSDCASPAPVIAKSGTTIRPPVGSVQRFQLVYQGSEIGVTALRGVDMIVGGSDGPFSVAKHSGYWAEVRDASGKTTFTRLFQDPTHREAPAGNGGFGNATIDSASPRRSSSTCRALRRAACSSSSGCRTARREQRASSRASRSSDVNQGLKL